MKRFDFYKELYFKEQERKKTLNDSLTLPVGVVSGEIALLFYFYNTIFTISSKIPLWILLIFIIAALCILFSILFLTYSYFDLTIKKDENSKFQIDSSFDYKYFDSFAKYEEYYCGLHDYYDEPNIDDRKKSDADLEKVLIKHLVFCIDYNTNLNEIKVSRLWKAKLFLVLGLIFSFSLLIYPMINEPTSEKIQKVNIVEPINIKIMSTPNEGKSGNDNPAPKVQETPKKQPKVKPQEPKIRSIPEGKEPAKGKPLFD